jgi:copper chaperone CopZ
MMDDTDSIGTPPRTFREQVRPGRVERLLIVRPDDAADEEAARSELEDLPGVVGVTINTLTRSFDIAFDSTIVSDDELAAALQLHGYDLISWQEVIHAAQQRIWLLEQIQALAPRAELELAERGTYADGVTKGSVDAYIRAARAFGLVTDAEIIQLIPAHFLMGPD